MSASGPRARGTQEERNLEIWSTRIQRELLALTTDNADAESTEEVRIMLPPFARVEDHSLDILGGSCQVHFLLEIVVMTNKSSQSAVVASGGRLDSSEAEAESADSAALTKTLMLVVTLDASLPKKPDGSFDTSVPTYPFQEPVATLRSGQDHFPLGSSIRNGDRIAMDLDWTPSLHLTDAVLNIGLKIKESILQQEPFHAAPPVTPDPVLEDITRGARRLASSISKASSSAFSKAFASTASKAKPSSSKGSPGRTSKQSPQQQPQHHPHHASQKVSPNNRASNKPPQGEVRIGQEINLLEEPWVNAQGVYSCKAIRRPPFVEDAMVYAAQKEDQQTFSSPSAMFRSFTQSARSVLEESFLMITETHIIELKASKLNMTTGKVTFAIPIELMAKLKFRRQESVSLFFKPAPDDPLVYMCPDSSDVVHQIQNVLKRHGVKGKHTNAAAHRAINDALQLVQEIQTKELALKHDPTVQRVNEIMDLYRQAAERFEVAGDIRHEEVVTHMRKFLALPLTTSILDGSFQKPPSAIGMSSKKKNPASPDGSSSFIPEGEILTRTEEQLLDDDLDHALYTHSTGGSKVSGEREEKESDKAFEENIDNLLKEAQEDVKTLQLGSNNDDDTHTAASTVIDDDGESALADVAADLDAMMREADKELAALMSS